MSAVGSCYPSALLGDVCRFIGGGTPSKKRDDYYDGHIPWATVKDFKTFRIVDTQDHISEAGLADSAANLVQAGTVLLVTRVGLGKVAIADQPMAINQDIKAVIPSAEILPEFLFWFLLSRGPEIERMGTGATVKGVTLNDIRAIRMPLPPMPEQCCIVDILSRAEGIVRLRREAQKKAAALIPALFIDMFGDPAMNPKGWKITPFGSVISPIEFGISAALSKDADYQPGRVGVLRIANLTPDGKLDLSDVRYLDVSEKKKQQLSLHGGDILFNWRNSPNWIGKTAIVEYDIDCIFASFLYRFRVLEGVSDKIFIWFYMNFLRTRGFFERLCRQAVSQANLGRDELAAIKIFLPPIQLQQAFAEKCRDIFSIQSQQSTAMQKAEATFNALLSRTFSTANS